MKKDKVTKLQFFLFEPVKLRSRLAVINFPKVLRMNCSQFVLNLAGCRQFINAMHAKIIDKTTLVVLFKYLFICLMQMYYLQSR